jgi:hypothetical protein
MKSTDLLLLSWWSTYFYPAYLFYDGGRTCFGLISGAKYLACNNTGKVIEYTFLLRLKVSFDSICLQVIAGNIAKLVVGLFINQGDY